MPESRELTIVREIRAALELIIRLEQPEMPHRCCWHWPIGCWTNMRRAFPPPRRALKQDGEMWRFVQHRRGLWLNNRVEQDHRRVKRRTGPMLGFPGFWTARRTLAGVEVMAMLAKGQVRAAPADDLPAQRAFVHQVFGLAA